MLITSRNKDNKITSLELLRQAEYLKTVFDDVYLINPIEQEILNIGQEGLEDTHTSCSLKCPLAHDKAGCICRQAYDYGENRCRFFYNDIGSKLIVAKTIQMAYRKYILVLVMNVTNKFTFGAEHGTEVISEILEAGNNIYLDPLTQIYNRKYTLENIDTFINESIDKRTEFCLACIDIDNFKKFNDTYGHDFGDKVLQLVANKMKESTSKLQRAYPIRIGGDEFIIVAIGINKKSFKAAMNNLCIDVSESFLKFGKESVGVNISIGTSEVFFDKAFTYKELYAKADAQLYESKKNGKGQVR